MSAPMCMPLHTSQEAPSFHGATDSLSRYIATIETLCQGRRRATGPELIKYAVYYADETSEDVFAAARYALADPSSWDEFKVGIRGMYPQREIAHVPAPLHGASLPSPAVLLAPDAIQALLAASAPSSPHSIIPARPLLPPAFMPQASLLPLPSVYVPVPLQSPLLPVSVPAVPPMPSAPLVPPAASVCVPLPPPSPICAAALLPAPVDAARLALPLAVPCPMMQSPPLPMSALAPLAHAKPPSPAAPTPTLPAPTGPLPARVLHLPIPPVPPDPRPVPSALPMPTVHTQLLSPVSVPQPVLAARVIRWPPNGWLSLPVVPPGASDVTRMPPPCDPSLPEADPAPAIMARVAVLKAPVGIRESRRRMRRIGRRVYQVF